VLLDLALPGGARRHAFVLEVVPAGDMDSDGTRDLWAEDSSQAVCFSGASGSVLDRCPADPARRMRRHLARVDPVVFVQGQFPDRKVVMRPRRWTAPLD
jgi:hypothetical protein